MSITTIALPLSADFMTMSSISFNSCSAPFSAGVRLLCVGLVVLVAVWTSFLTKSIKDSKVVFLLGFGIHELFFLNLGRGMSLSSSESDDPSTGQSLSLAEKYSLIRRDLANLSRPYHRMESMRKSNILS